MIVIINNIPEALELVGKSVVIKNAKYFSDKHIVNHKYLKNVYANFVSRKCEVLNYTGGENGKYLFELFNGKKVATFESKDFELSQEVPQ